MVYRGERMLDGGLIESIPSETALREGATHVLVLRSRPAGYRRPPHAKLAERLALREHPELAELLRDGPYAYNRHASELARMTNEADVSPVFQIAVPERTRLIGRLEANGRRVVEALQIGAAAMASTILRESIELRWQPVAYSAVPGGRPAAEALLAPTAG
jgi:predicted patatin/cPLA2 family phospholipase